MNQAIGLAGAKYHWLALTHYRMRVATFAALFAAIGMHLAGRGYGPLAWGLLALQFLVYPHLLIWRSRHAKDWFKAELSNMLFDALLMGMWSGALGFPTWIAFTLLMGTALNNAISRGPRRTLGAILIFCSGALAMLPVTGFMYAPDTSLPTTVLCLVGLTAYVIGVGSMAFAQNIKLRQTRETLRQQEQALFRANVELEARLSEIQRLQSELEEQATRDPLTGLYNRRYFDGTLERELARAKRDASPLCLMMIDLDHFKKVNDTYGHQVGDEVLRMFGAMLRDSARAGDIPCRYGGEEFLLLMPNMPPETARQRAEQLRAEFAERVAKVGAYRIQATLSIGIAAYPEHGETPDILTQAADLALYLAKSGGRNRVVVFKTS